MNWKGVIPAVTTPFSEDGTIDHAFFAKHLKWMLDSGCTGVVLGGSLGEAATLTQDEKQALIETATATVGSSGSVAIGIASLSTAQAIADAQLAERLGCQGLMVLPPYVYKGDWRETKAHFSAVIEATGLSCMLYNNPVAYGTDALPEQIAELTVRHANLHAVKESSTDVRRLAAIRALIGTRLELLVGVDDVIVEGIAMGATGWVAGLVNAFPVESVEIFNRTLAEGPLAVTDLYSWFLPLLRLDTVPKFVQLIKLVQQEVGMGSERVRAPRLEITGTEREEALAVIRHAIAHRPTLATV